MSDVTPIVHCYWPLYRVSSSSITESVLDVCHLGSYVSLVGNAILYAFATRMVTNAASISIYQHVATNYAGYSFASQHIMSDSIASVLWPRCSCSPEPAIKCPMLQRKLIYTWNHPSLRTTRFRSLPVETMEVHCLRLSGTRVCQMWGWEWHHTV